MNGFPSHEKIQIELFKQDKSVLQRYFKEGILKWVYIYNSKYAVGKREKDRFAKNLLIRFQDYEEFPFRYTQSHFEKIKFCKQLASKSKSKWDIKFAKSKENTYETIAYSFSGQKLELNMCQFHNKGCILVSLYKNENHEINKISFKQDNPIGQTLLSKN